MSDPQQPPVPPFTSTPQPPAGPPPYGTQPPQYGQPTRPAQPSQSPQPPYGAQSPAQGYVLNGHTAQPGHPAPAGPSTANTPGRIGFIVGLIGLAVGIVFSMASQAMIRTGSYELIGVLGGLGNLLSLLAAVTALILGIIGLRRPGAPHGQAGIAVGLGIAGTVSALFALLIGAFTSLLYAF